MGEPTHDTTVRRVMEMLRRDLKLGGDVSMDERTPLFGDGLDLDSLDVVLLVTSLEKEFGVKVPDRATGRRVFQTVGTIAEYVENPGPAPASAEPASGTQAADLPSLLDRLPHQPPFRFVTELTTVVPKDHGEGVWRVWGEEPVLAGHFPGRPVVPGVLLAEALAQLSGLVVFAAEDSAGGEARLAETQVRFHAPVEPPADIHLSSRLQGVAEGVGRFEVRAAVEGSPVADGTLALAGL